MKATILTYQGWLLTLCLAIVLSLIVSPARIRPISADYLQNLIENREVASITIVEKEPGIRERYTAEITLTPAARKKYDQLRATFLNPEKGPHFISAIGSSESDVRIWKEGLQARDKIRFAFTRRY
jgi:hypothetical protein